MIIELIDIFVLCMVVCSNIQNKYTCNIVLYLHPTLPSGVGTKYVVVYLLHPFYKPSPGELVYHLPYQMCLDPELIVVIASVTTFFCIIISYYSPSFSSRQFHKSHTDVNSWPLPNMAGNERHVFSSEKWKLVKKTTVWCSFSWQQTDPTAT